VIRVDQTIVGVKGNCYSACLASLFEIPIEEAPYGFETYKGTDDTFWEPIYQWVADKGYGIFHCTVTSDFDISSCPGYVIGVGKIEDESTMHHAVIYYNGILHHDPSPMKRGIAKLEQVDLLYPLDPSRLTFKGY
jgi:hypothetical protein